MKVVHRPLYMICSLYVFSVEAFCCPSVLKFFQSQSSGALVLRYILSYFDDFLYIFPMHINSCYLDIGPHGLDLNFCILSSPSFLSLYHYTLSFEECPPLYFPSSFNCVFFISPIKILISNRSVLIP